MQSVANRVIEITPNGTIDRLMSFDEYLEDERVHQLREELYMQPALVDNLNKFYKPGTFYRVFYLKHVLCIYESKT